MTLFSRPTDSTPRRRWWTPVLLVLFLTAGVGYFVWSRIQIPSDNVEPTARVLLPPPAAIEPADSSAEAPLSDRLSEPEADPEPSPEPSRVAETSTAAVPPPVIFRVTSDVEGAEVFVDRQYVGTTPFESHDITRGRHRINVSASGYGSHAEDVEINDEVTTLAVMFRQVALNQQAQVIHKHRFGNCEGQLVADTSGIHYQTNHGDSFNVAFDALEEFEVDYLEHNLRIKVNGGRTYNFTDRQENADSLFVFHREVEEARERLARGDRPASQ